MIANAFGTCNVGAVARTRNTAAFTVMAGRVAEVVVHCCLYHQEKSSSCAMHSTGAYPLLLCFLVWCCLLFTHTSAHKMQTRVQTSQCATPPCHLPLALQVHLVGHGHSQVPLATVFSEWEWSSHEAHLAVGILVFSSHWKDTTQAYSHRRKIGLLSEQTKCGWFFGLSRPISGTKLHCGWINENTICWTN